MHNINVAIQIVSAQKNAYARTLSYECVCSREREKYERERSRCDVISTTRWNTGKDGIYYKFHINKVLIIILCLWNSSEL